MTDRIVIKDESLARQLENIARQEQRSVQEVLASMLDQYQSRGSASDDVPITAREVRLDAYRRARAYWQQVGEAARAGLSDAELDEQFWLFDGDGIPRLKSDQDTVKLSQHSLRHAGRVLNEASFRSGHNDISQRSRDILNSEFADYLLNRMERPVNDDKPSSD